MSKIIVIDDDPTSLQTLSAILEGGGHQVCMAGTAQEGLECLKQHGADVVVTDLIMPDKDGIEVLRNIRLWPGHVRVIVVTGGGRLPIDFYTETVRKLGAEVVLKKPVSPDDLLCAV